MIWSCKFSSTSATSCKVVETGYPQITLKTVSSLEIYLQAQKMKPTKKYLQFSHSQVLTLTLLHSIFYEKKINLSPLYKKTNKEKKMIQTDRS
jgi:hypothetical protein